MALTLTSGAFRPNQPIPAHYTCDGEDASPPLTWAGVPAGTRSLALIIDDPDAPDPKHPRQVWVHWVLYNLPPDATGLAEAVALPSGAKVGRNDWQRADYGGPCPPIGRHRYRSWWEPMKDSARGTHQPEYICQARHARGKIPESVNRRCRS
ncbi:MAG: hypothetical protein H6R46_1482 [Proteobacteria bacterium]|nr:hypothetical protein [Pseudomonadota bacterium]